MDFLLSKYDLIFTELDGIDRVGDKGNIWYVGPEDKSCPRPKSEGNILSEDSR